MKLIKSDDCPVCHKTCTVTIVGKDLKEINENEFEFWCTDHGCWYKEGANKLESTGKNSN